MEMSGEPEIAGAIGRGLIAGVDEEGGEANSPFCHATPVAILKTSLDLV